MPTQIYFFISLYTNAFSENKKALNPPSVFKSFLYFNSKSNNLPGLE